MAIKVIKAADYSKVPKMLDDLKLGKKIKSQKLIILKPNLVLNKKNPATTKAELVEVFIKYCMKHSKAKIVVAEGSGGNATPICYADQGYNELTKKYDIELIDLNETETATVKSSKFRRFKEILYPKILLEGFVISIANLKEHSCAKVTMSLKNMLGCYPARHYGGNWKSHIHEKPVEYAIHDIIACKYPDFAIIDGITAGLKHECRPVPRKMNVIIAGDSLEADKKGAEILSYKWKDIPSLVFVDELRK